jgi:hypothetical protein
VLLGGRGDIEQIVSLAHEIGFDEFYNLWTRNEIPVETIEPVDDFLKRLTHHVFSRFNEAQKDELHLHVTHDIVIAAARAEYLSLDVDVGLAVPFLGGFGLSYKKGKLVGFNDGRPVTITRNLFT